MKRALFALVFTVSFAGAFAQNYQINFKDPKSVLGAMFYAAKTQDYAILQCLCDPFGEGDGDTKGICGLAYVQKQFEQFGSASDAQMLDEFEKTFSKSTITGQPQYYTEDGVKFARVPFNFTVDNKTRSETMVLVNRYGNWYLYSF